MESHLVNQVMHQPPEARPAILEGRWLTDGEPGTWLAQNPVSVLEGSADALDSLPGWLTHHVGRFPDGAAIGFVAYELARRFERLDLPTYGRLPDVSFAFYPQIERREPFDTIASEPRTEVGLHCNFDHEAYTRAVERIRAYIAAGDIYQANLTVRFSAASDRQAAERIYQRLRAAATPFRAFLKSPRRTILSASPERFFRVAGHRILASPIKGTMARPPHDAGQAAAALRASAKDRAENLMIVDLLRNDLGRICDFASIRTRLWQTEALPQLVHLVSHVEGTLRPESGIREIVRALFPCGSITGAPKIRAMQILAEIEGAPRGVSMGAIGIMRGPASPRRGGQGGWQMDFSVAIRTMVIEDGQALFNVGGGIVYDSSPAAEYQEMLLKAQPLFQALGAA